MPGMAPEPVGIGCMRTPPPSSWLRQETAGAYGWGGLASTYFRIDPLEGIIIIKMAQIIHRGEDGNSVVSRNANADIHTVAYQALVD